MSAHSGTCPDWFAKAATLRLDGLNKRNLFRLSFGGWEPKIKVVAELVSPEVLPLSLQMAAFLLCPRTVIPLSVGDVPAISSCSCKDPSHNELGLYPYDLILP